MIIDLNKLNQTSLIELDEDVNLDANKLTMGIKELKDVHVQGFIKYNEADELELNLTIKGVMKLEDVITLELVDHPFSINIEETILKLGENYAEYFNKLQNTLDISEILWQNIVLEVPLRIRKDDKDIILEGEGWQLNKKEEDTIDPRLAKLNELLDNRKE